MSLARGVDLFNQARYWDAHEAWEESWMPDRGGPDAAFYKGLIQVAAGCLHYGRGNRRGALNKWRSGVEYLRAYPAIHHGIDLAGLIAEVDDLRTALDGQGWPELAMPQLVARID